MEFSIKMGFAKWAGKLVWQGNVFLVNSTKTFIFILVVKHITCNTKIGEIITFCDCFQRTMQAAVISRKTPTTRSYFRNCEVPLYP